MMEEKIDKIIEARKWTFVEISELQNTIHAIVAEIEGELTLSEKIGLIWDLPIKDETAKIFGIAFNELVGTQLAVLVAERIGAKLKEAEVVFNKKEIKVEPIPELPPLPYEGKIREDDGDSWPTNNNADGIIEMPKGVKRV